MPLATMCCCPEEGCLPNVCFATIEFRGVEAPTFSTPPHDDAPPLLDDDEGFNVPAPGDAWTDADICSVCPTWNREWQVFLLGGVKFGDAGVVDFLLAVGQARNDETDGYTQEPDVYKIPDAGDVCFPCASVGDDTGLALRITCNENMISADLTFKMDGHSFLAYSWNEYLPQFLPSGIGAPQEADFLNDDFHTNYNGTKDTPNYTPAGVCLTDPTEAFPCTVEGADDIDRFYDVKNCFWDNKLKPYLRFYKCSSIGPDPNPTFCDPCDAEFIAHNSASFSGIGGGSETLINPFDQPDAATAVNNNVWRLCADGASNSGIVAKINIDPCGAARNTESTSCFYDIFLRWGWNNSATDPGSVVIFSHAGPGPIITFDTDGFLGTPLPFVTGTLDGPHNTHTINGVKYRRIGQIFAQCDSRISIEVRGPNTNTDCMDFDHLVLQRL